MDYDVTAVYKHAASDDSMVSRPTWPACGTDTDGFEFIHTPISGKEKKYTP